MKLITKPKSGLLLKTGVVLFLALTINQVSGQLSTYTFSSLSGVAPEDMTTGATALIGPNIDDGISPVTNIGFIFTFNGVSYTQFSVNSNGLLRLGSTIVSSSAANQVTGASDNPKIMPYWDDLHTGTDGEAHYKVTGVSPSRKLIVEWVVTVPKNAASAANTKFQVWLTETSNVIQFVYGSGGNGVPANSVTGGYSAGLANSATDYMSVNSSSGTASTLTEYNANITAIGYQASYKFTPPAPTGIPNCAASAFPANNATGISTSVVLTWASGGGAPSGYDVYFGTSSSPPLVSGNQASTNYTPGTLLVNTTYYWKVVPKNSFGDASGCVVNHFTTFTSLSYEVTRATGITYSSIAGTGNAVASWRNSTNTDDNLSNAVPIGFTFTYQGISYSNVLISTNGFLTFNTGTASLGGGSAYGPSNSALSATTSPSMLAPFYDDLVCQGNPYTQASLNATFRYLTSGSSPSRVFTVEWISMQTFGNTGANLNFQIRLYESTNSIEFDYGTMEGFNGTTNFSFTYSSGINASVVSSPPNPGELITQQIANTRSFSNAASNALNIVPDCNSSVTLSPGSYTAYVPVNSVPANDNAANAILLLPNASPCVALCGTYFTSANATQSATAACIGSPDDDVWFKFTATNPSTTIKVLCSGGYNASVQLLDNSLNNITCQNGTGAGLTEIINTTTLTTGNNYYVRVYDSLPGYGINGTFSICISATPLPPSNDDCGGAITLTVNTSPVFIAGTNTTTATGSTHTAVPCNGSIADDDVWYKFTANTTAATIVVQSGTGFDAALQLFSGSCPFLTTSLQCANLTSTGGTETMYATGLTVGTVYYMRVYHASSGAGTGQFTIAVYSLPPGCASSFSPPNGTSLIPLSGTTLSWNSVSGATGYDVYLDSINPPAHLLASNIASTSIFSGALTAGNVYYWKVAPRNGAGAATGCIVNAFAPPQPDAGLYVKVFLAGFYVSDTTMNAGVDPVNYPGLADTITVSLAGSTMPYNILYSRKALLSTHGLAHASFPAQAALGDYFIVVNHRNSLETWSSMAFGFNTNDTIYDFTYGASQAYGNNQQPLGGGRFGIYSCDINQDGIVESTDYSIMENEVQQFLFGYYVSDVTGDQVVESADYSMMENNVQQFLFSARP